MATGLKFINGDFIITSKNLEFVQDIDKTRRDFVKFLLTDKETTDNKTTYTRYNPLYGTEINRVNLYRNLTSKSIMDLMEQKLGESIKYYIALQEARSNLSTGEVITDLTYSVYQDISNPQKIKFTLQMKVASNNSTTLNFSQGI